MKNNYRSLWVLPEQMPVLVLSILCGMGCIAVLTLILRDTAAGVILLDYETKLFAYPLTIQNLLLMLFFIGLGQVFIRWRISLREFSFLGNGYLPEDDATVLRSQDLGPIRRRTAAQFDGEHGFLPSLIDICILQFQSSKSVDQTVSVLNSSLELLFHRVDLRYSMLRYIVWAIPTIGFIGTVVGIAWTLYLVNPEQPDLKELTGSLAVAFNTTLVALFLSAILVFMLHLVQRQEEQAVNRAGNYTLKNLVNRLYVES